MTREVTKNNLGSIGTGNYFVFIVQLQFLVFSTLLLHPRNTFWDNFSLQTALGTDRNILETPEPRLKQKHRRPKLR